MRRRALMGGKSIDYIELPDYVRIDFTTTSENFVAKICYGSCSVSNVILDGISINTYNSASFKCVTVPSPGEHTLYCKIRSTTSSNSGFTYIVDSVDIPYMRLPYNITEVCPAVSFRTRGNKDKIFGQIDILDSRLWSVIVNNILVNNINSINIPVGSKTLYEEAGYSTSALNKINEVDFKYKIQ